MKTIYSSFETMRGKTRLIPHAWIKQGDIVNAVIYNPGHLLVSTEIRPGVGIKLSLSEKPPKRIKVYYQVARP